MPPAPQRAKEVPEDGVAPRNSFNNQAKKPLRVEECMKIQSKEYFEHPVYKIISLALLVSFTMAPYILYQKYGNQWMGLFSEPKWAIFVVIVGVGFFFHGGLNLAYLALYRANNPFFEQFKSSDQPWPWVTEPEVFKKKFDKALKQIGFNITVCALPVMCLLSAYYPFKTQAEELPSL